MCIKCTLHVFPYNIIIYKALARIGVKLHSIQGPVELKQHI